jgi:hypothetical protein
LRRLDQRDHQVAGQGRGGSSSRIASAIAVAFGGAHEDRQHPAWRVVLTQEDQRLDRMATGMRIAHRARGIARQSVVVGMGLSSAAMGFAAFGFIPPVAGAVLQEGIDVAVIMNALRVLRRPAWEVPFNAIPEQWARQLHGGHAELRPGLDEIRLPADQLDELGTVAVARLRHSPTSCGGMSLSTSAPTNTTCTPRWRHTSGATTLSPQ